VLVLGNAAARISGHLGVWSWIPVIMVYWMEYTCCDIGICWRLDFLPALVAFVVDLLSVSVLVFLNRAVLGK
jgi:hypothetical protein